MRIARRTLMAGVLLGFVQPGLALAIEDGDAPLLVLRTSDPWAFVLGADAARFVLYGNGTVIYARPDGLRTVKLDPSERAALMGQMASRPCRASRENTNPI